MSKLRSSEVIYAGPLMKKGLEDYMAASGRNKFEVKERNFKGREEGPWITCNQCGSIGPFSLVSNVEGDRNNDYVNEGAKKVLDQVLKRRINITVGSRGEFRFKDMGVTGFDLEELRENLLMVDSYLEEYLECLNCQAIFTFMFETVGGQGIYEEEFQGGGNFFLFSDEPTYTKTEKDKDGKTMIVDSKITRNGLIEMCATCFCSDEFKDVYEEKEKVIDSKGISEVDHPGGICDMCTCHHDLSLFDITPKEVMYYRKNNKFLLNFNPDQIDIMGDKK